MVERQPKHVVLDEETVAKRFEHKGLIESMRRVIIHLCGDCGGGGGGGGGGAGEAATRHRPVQCGESWQSREGSINSKKARITFSQYRKVRQVLF